MNNTFVIQRGSEIARFDLYGDFMDAYDFVWSIFPDADYVMIEGKNK